MPKFTLDNKEISFQKGEDILHAALRENNFIPHYCAHEALSRVATCRMCLVDVVDAGNGKAIPKLQTACSTPIVEGMKVVTNNNKVKTARHSIMEFLLVNHPLDCAICDQSGECDLQDFSFEYGTGQSIVQHEKRVYGWRDIGSFLQLERNRCIHCSRCVRFTQEITGTNEMGVFGRNYQLTVDTFTDYPLFDNFQGNLADICPVGAITTKDFRFKNRVWLEKKMPSVCAGCSTGCNINISYYKGQVHRFLPRENMAVNKWWMCDIGRLSFHKLVDKQQRQLNCLWEKEPIAWRKAVEIVKEKIQELKADSRIVVIASNQSTNEEIQALKEFCSNFLNNAEIYLPEKPKEKPQKKNQRFIETLFMNDRSPNSAGLEKIKIANQKNLNKLQTDKQKIDCLIILENGMLQDWFLELLNNVSFVLYLTALKTALIPKAHLIIPTQTHLEKKGTFTNKNGITQQNNPAIPQIAGKDECAIWFEIAQVLTNTLTNEESISKKPLSLTKEVDLISKKDENLLTEFTK